MTVYTNDTMTDSNWKDLHLHTGEVGASWQRHPSTPSSRWYIFNNRVHCGVAGNQFSSGQPATADYSVTCDYTINTDIGNLGIAGRMSTTLDTYYGVYYFNSELVLMKRVAGVTTGLDWWFTTLSAGGTTYELSLEMIGSAIKVYVDGIERISTTDSSITAAGRGGVRSPGINDAATGKHIDNFVVHDAASVIVPKYYSIGLVG